jgi:hypothetical protein
MNLTNKQHILTLKNSVTSVWIFVIYDELNIGDDFNTNNFRIKMFYGRKPLTCLIFTKSSQFMISIGRLLELISQQTGPAIESLEELCRKTNI